MDASELLDTRDYFSRTGIWPMIPAEAKPEQWLANFLPDEHEYALALLGAFIYYNARNTSKLFRAAFQSMAQHIVVGDGNYASKKATWTAHLRRLILTYPTGESPSATDSGYVFARDARQHLHIDESRILDPKQALEAQSRHGSLPIVFVDDFAGSGNQFLKTWTRPHQLSNGTSVSFESLAAGGVSGPIFYTPAVCTQLALERIKGAAPGVTVTPAHLLPPEAALVHPLNRSIPEGLKAGLPDVIRNASARAGVNGAYGFHSLALALAFEHSVPDATLPIYWRESPGWTPLVRRR